MIKIVIKNIVINTGHYFLLLLIGPLQTHKKHTYWCCICFYDLYFRFVSGIWLSHEKYFGNDHLLAIVRTRHCTLFCGLLQLQSWIELKIESTCISDIDLGDLYYLVVPWRYLSSVSEWHAGLYPEQCCLFMAYHLDKLFQSSIKVFQVSSVLLGSFEYWFSGRPLFLYISWGRNTVRTDTINWYGERELGSALINPLTANKTNTTL